MVNRLGFPRSKNSISNFTWNIDIQDTDTFKYLVSLEFLN